MKQLVKKLKKFLKNENIVDILIFGSSVKGKIKTKDLDLAILIKSEININEEIRNIFDKVDINYFKISNYDNPLWITLIKEGYSVKHNAYLHEVYRIKPSKLFKYSLKELTNSKKVMFERAIKKFKFINKLSNRVVLVPINHSGEFEDFLKLWGLDIETEEYALLPIIRKEF